MTGGIVYGYFLAIVVPLVLWGVTLYKIRHDSISDRDRELTRKFA